MLANRMVIKRMVMEKILFSEIGALQERYRSLFGEDVRTEQLEARVYGDISMALYLFNHIVPSTIRTGFTFVRQARDLYLRRQDIHMLGVLRPTVVMIVTEVIEELRRQFIDVRQLERETATRSQMTRVVTNIVDGLSDIQTNNMQGYQLQQLDTIMAEDVSQKQGWITYLDRVYRTMQNRNVLDFASEVYLVQRIMQQKNINHETYRRIQNDIDSVVRQGRRCYDLVRQGSDIVDMQNRVSELLSLPNFIEEEEYSNHLEEVDQQMCQRTQKPLLNNQRGIESEEIQCLNAEQGSTRNNAKVGDGKCAEQEDANAEKEWSWANLQDDYTDSTASHPSRSLFGSGLIPLSNRDPRFLRFGLEELRELYNIREITVRRLVFTYPGAPTAALKIDTTGASSQQVSNPLVFQRGKTYALVGQNRSGKSTLVKILAKLRQPSEEQEYDVSANDIPYTAIPRHLLRKKISYVSQKPFIFPGTVEDNIRLGDQTSSHEDVLKAAELAGLFVYDRTVSTAPIVATDEAYFKDQTPNQLEDDLWQSGAMELEESKELDGNLEWKEGAYDRDEEVSVDDTSSSLGDGGNLVTGRGIEVLSRGRTLPAATAAFTIRGTGDRPLKPWERNRQWWRNKVGAAASWAKHNILSLWRDDLVDDDTELKFDESLPEGAASVPNEGDHLFDEMAISASNMVRDFSRGDESLSMEATSSFGRCEAQRAMDFSTEEAVLRMETGIGGSMLSGGFAQSVALARIFLKKESQVILLDEAMGQMDAHKKKTHILPHLMQFVKEHNMTLILVSHDMATVCSVVDHVYVLEKGDFVDSGSHADLVERRSTAYIRLMGGSVSF